MYSAHEPIETPLSYAREGSLGVYTNREACTVSTSQEYLPFVLPALLGV